MLGMISSQYQILYSKNIQDIGIGSIFELVGRRVVAQFAQNIQYLE